VVIIEFIDYRRSVIQCAPQGVQSSPSHHASPKCGFYATALWDQSNHRTSSQWGHKLHPVSGAEICVYYLLVNCQ